MTTTTIDIAGLEGGHVTLTPEALGDLDSRLTGRLLRPGDQGWDDAVRVWNAMAAKVPALAEKRVNAVADYTTGLPFYEKAMGKGNPVMMPWADHGFDMYSMSIIASEKTIKDQAKMLRAFLEASYSGWRDVMESPKSALEIFKKRVPEIDLSIIEPNMMMGLELMKTERYAKNGIGWMDRGKMCGTVEFINTYMPDMPRKVGCDEVFTNDLLTKIEPPRK